MSDAERDKSPAEVDDAPIDRTDAATTKADLFDTAQWLDRRLEEVHRHIAGQADDSGDITRQILGDLAGIRAEQIHFARRLDEMRVELRTDLRRELHKALAAPEPQHDPPARRAAPVLTIGLPILLIGVLVAAAVLAPEETLLWLQKFSAGGMSWLRNLWTGF